MSQVEETERLVPNNVPRTNLHPIPANRLALDAQIQAVADSQRRLRQRRRIYYIIFITSITMTILSILSFVAWIIHSSSVSSINNSKIIDELIGSENNNINSESSLAVKSAFPKFHARKNPTRTINTEKVLKKRSTGLDSDDEEKDEVTVKSKSEPRGPTRTRKLSFAPQKMIDYKPQFRKI